MPRRSLTRRQVLRAGALAAAAAGVRPASPALAARPASLFELELDGAAAHAAAAAGGWRTTGVLRAPRRFDLIGLRWARGSHAEAQVRARRRGGRWTAWAHLNPTGEHGPDHGRPPAGTDPAFVGAADEFQLRLRGAPRALRARFVRALPTATLARRVGRRLRRRTPTAHGAQGGGPPPMIMRSEWGADAVPPRQPPLYGEIDLAFVHHTVTSNDYGPEDSAGIVLGIARYHRDSNGWNDIGYNFLVDKYGQVFEGRAGGIQAAVVGAQAQGYNSVSTGIACLGTFSTVAETPEAMNAVARLIGWKLSLHEVPVQGKVTVTSAGGPANRYPAGTPVTLQRISGHRDGDATSCPGEVLYGQLADLRSAAARFAGPGSGLRLYVARRVQAVQPIDVTGYLQFPDGTSSSGVPVDIEYRPGNVPGAAWAPLATTTCAVDGSFRATVELPWTGRLRAVFRGDATRPGLRSPWHRVKVVADMNMSLSRRRVRVGRRIRAYGDVEPADHVRMTLQRRISPGRWIRERRRIVPVRDGSYSFRVKLRHPGKYHLTVNVGSVRRRRTLRAF